MKTPPADNTIRRRLFRGSLIITGTRFLNQALGVLNVGLLARVLPLETLGLFYLVRHIAALGCLAGNFGAIQSAQKLLGATFYARPGLLPQIKNRLSAIVALTSALTLGLCAVFWSPLTEHVLKSPELKQMLIFTAAYIALEVAQEMQSAILRAIDRMFLSALAFTTINRGLFFVGLSYFVFTGRSPSLVGVLDLWLAAAAVNALAGAVFVAVSMAQHQGKPTAGGESLLPSYAEILKLNVSMGVSNVATNMRSSLSVLIVGAVLGPAAAGVLGPIQALSKLVSFLLEAINLTLAAIISGIQDKPRAVMEAICREAATCSALVGVPMALAFLCFGDLILSVALGPRFADCGLILFLVAIGPLTKSISGSPGVILQMTGFERTVMNVNLIFSALTLGCIYLAAKYTGLVGVAAALGLNMTAQFVYLMQAVRRRLGIKCYAGPFTRDRLGRIVAKIGTRLHPAGLKGM